MVKTSSKLKVQSSKQYQIETNPKFKTQNSKQNQIVKASNSKLVRLEAGQAKIRYEFVVGKQWVIKETKKPYDLEVRTFAFAKEVIALIGKLTKSIANMEIGKQVVRSAGSVGANYIEAGESLSDKDFMFRIKICRKEAKESCYWLKLLDCNNELNDTREELVKEAFELTKIFGSIIYKKR